jgi:tRNA A-37 threonylcarbamoyl transferase component Bud32
MAPFERPTAKDSIEPRSVHWIKLWCGGHRWHVRSELAGLPWFVEMLGNPGQLFEPPAQPLRPLSANSPRAIVRRTFTEWPERPVVIKRYRPKSFWSPFKDLCRRSQASRTLRRTWELQALGVPVASVLAAQVRSRGGWGESWIIMEEVPAAQNLYDSNARYRHSLDRRGALRLLSRLMALLHDKDYEHTDPSLTNFLISLANPARPVVVLIDLDGLRHRRQSLRSAAKGLRRLALRAHVSRWECLRFLVEYVRARRCSITTRDLARAVGFVNPGASSPPPWTNTPSQISD